MNRINSDEFPPVIFKFMTGLEALRTSTLKFTPPNLLNDPFELRPSATKVIFEKNGKEEVDFISHDELQVSYDEFCKEYGILSLSGLHRKENTLNIKPPLENNLLWSHYADGHRGICMALNPKHESIIQLGRLEKVRYSLKRVLFASSKSGSYIRQLMLTKSPLWEYESEWRVIERLSSCCKKSEGIYLKEFDPQALIAVLIGAGASKEIHDEVKDLLATRYPDCKGSGYMHLASDSFGIFPLPLRYPNPVYIGSEDLRIFRLNEGFNMEIRQSGCFVVTKSDEFLNYRENEDPDYA